jgi:acetate kinase
MLILSINSGSTSLKCCLYDLPVEEADDQAVTPAWEADISWKGDLDGALETTRNGSTTSALLHANSREEAIGQILSGLWSEDGPVKSANEIVAVAHRIVHGGPNYSRSTVIGEQVIEYLRNLEELAPNHGKENVRAIVVARKILPQALQVAVFDTAFHHNLPVTAAIYAVPYHWYEHDHVRRYGFHGISLEYLTKRAAQMLPGSGGTLKLIACHLGGGSSLSAIDSGRCLDTTMGFTPLEGVPMQTRSGSIDPGLIMHQLQRGGYSIEELNAVLTKESGMKGLSGLSGDMKEIEAAMQSGNARAQLAFDVFVRGIAKFAASLLPILGSLDALIFAGGIGEHSSNVRRSVCTMLSPLGVAIDEEKNVSGKGDRDISSTSAKVRVLVIHTKEELAMARSACQIALESSQKV